MYLKRSYLTLQFCQSNQDHTLEVCLHLETNLKRMLFLNLKFVPEHPKLKESYANPVLPSVLCI